MEEAETRSKGAAKRDLIVVGASAGGIDVLSSFVAGLPAELPAAILVVMHLSISSPGVLPRILARADHGEVAHAREGEKIRHGRIYVAPPDRHLLVRGQHLHLSQGPRENRTRPAIDPLFRSAAIYFRSRVIGVVLSGMLDDGTEGLAAIKRCGGLAVVQDPADAPFPAMPTSALTRVQVDHCLPVKDMGALLARLVAEPAPAPPEVPADLLLEDRLAAGIVLETGNGEQEGTATSLICPDCGGPLHAIDGVNGERYRCLVGHAFTLESLMEGKTTETERALWAALQSLEEKARLLERMARREEERGGSDIMGYAQQAAETRRHSNKIREVLLAGTVTADEA